MALPPRVTMSQHRLARGGSHERFAVLATQLAAGRHRLRPHRRALARRRRARVGGDRREQSTVARIIGVVLAVYAIALLWNASRVHVSRGETLAAVVLNAAWVLGSIAVIELGVLSTLGNVAVGGVALAVLGFALLEIVG